MRVVSNSSPLIYLAKAGKLELLKRLFTIVLIPEAVYAEVVVRGIEKSQPEAVSVRRAVEAGWLRVEKSKPLAKLLEISGEIHAGETEAISLAKKINAGLLLVDDAAARSIAEGYGLKVHGTVFVLLLALQKKLLDKQEAKKTLNAFVSKGFRLAPEIYARLWEEIEKYPQ